MMNRYMHFLRFRNNKMLSFCTKLTKKNLINFLLKILLLISLLFADHIKREIDLKRFYGKNLESDYDFLSSRRSLYNDSKG